MRLPKRSEEKRNAYYVMKFVNNIIVDERELRVEADFEDDISELAGQLRPLHVIFDIN